jgi:hypothetical protein
MWGALRIDRWPMQVLPRIPNLRVLRGVDLLASYRRLTEITRLLSKSGHGDSYEALSHVL